MKTKERKEPGRVELEGYWPDNVNAVKDSVTLPACKEEVKEAERLIETFCEVTWDHIFPPNSYVCEIQDVPYVFFCDEESRLWIRVKIVDVPHCVEKGAGSFMLTTGMYNVTTGNPLGVIFADVEERDSYSISGHNIFGKPEWGYNSLMDALRYSIKEREEAR